MIKKISFFVILVVVGLSSFVRADVANSTENNFSYSFHLYYDNGQLSADRDFQFKYDVISAPYTQSALNTQFPYRGEIVNMVGETAKRFEFDPKQGDVNFTKGKISINAPYVADGQKVVFYDNQNQPVLTISVSDSSFCNDDGICNADRGEDSLSCPKDCKQSLITPLPTTPTPSTGGSSGLWSSIIYVFVGLILAGGAWWFFKRRQNQKLPPLPTPGPVQSDGQVLPTPPVPPSQNNLV